MTQLSSVTLGSKATPVGPTVTSIGLGCMGMSGIYGACDEATATATIHGALDAGINLLDTGDFYGMGHNEMLIGRALHGRRDQAQISVKFGALRGPDNSWGGVDGRPAAVKNFLAYSLQRLGTDHVDIYRIARLDPQVPIEDTVGAIADMVKAGYVRHIGLSEVSADTVERAHRVHPIVDLQIEYSLISRGPEANIFPRLAALGIGVTAYGVFSRGLLSGSKPSGADDYRAHTPRFDAANFARNQALVARLQQLALQRGVTASQLALAWVRAKAQVMGLNLVALVGSRSPKQLNEVLAAADLQLSAQEVAQLEQAVPADAVAGTRYAAMQMAHLDSEK